MSRIQKYKDSLNKFIKEKSCLFEDEENSVPNTDIYTKIQKNDLICPILLLTIMNNQNKKNKISLQGYYIASSIEFMNTLIQTIETKGCEAKTCSDLVYYSNRSIQQNFESIKSSYHVQSLNFTGIVMDVFSQYNSTLKVINSLHGFKFGVTNKACHNSIVKWYIKSDNDVAKKFKTLKQVTKASMNDYVEKKYVSVCEFAIITGWLIGGGCVKDYTKLKRLANCFAIMYKISNDFENIAEDLKTENKYTSNYVLNYGLQDGYEVFLNNKQQFIEESMGEDMYTNTVKEIVDEIETKVDMIIDQTSPDLKSSYSSKR